ncbi:MAG TPA: SatD family protein [Bacillota bacterium]
MNHLYAVITADIIDSRRQTQWLSLLKTQLKQFRSRALLTGFTISRGDELQAVCSNLPDLPVLIRQLRYCCLPLKLRIAVGIGPVDAATLSQESSWDMNGKAFYLARNALELIESDQGKRPATLILSGDRSFDLSINAIYRLYDLIINKWTDKQWETVHAYESNETLMKTAAIFKVSWQNVQKICKAAHWDTITKTESDLSLLLENRFG